MFWYFKTGWRSLDLYCGCECVYFLIYTCENCHKIFIAWNQCLKFIKFLFVKSLNMEDLKKKWNRKCVEQLELTRLRIVERSQHLMYYLFYLFHSVFVLSNAAKMLIQMYNVVVVVATMRRMFSAKLNWTEKQKKRKEKKNILRMHYS